eukprot:CAMPEP_0172324364 /NCGR_PEP_ID=MMETSP1058-20130122/51185_1 /TAXON_ID=83371 /ORGANISM="Detonula confervacea, Strain CCMP 353" /LENGTH=785 /DNA_ID=CAMNT_0013040627 /DNA_START=68 /DNA_END=2422 /DNA_ORIENTATION=+
MSPPKIMFDDGSRIMQDYAEQAAASSHNNGESQPSSTPSTSSSSALLRGTVPLAVYYEVDRVAKESVDKLDWSENTSRGQLLKRILTNARNNNDGASSNNEKKEKQEVAEQKGHDGNSNDEDGFLCRIALQFPDELLADAPDVSWLMEEAISNAYKEKLMRPVLDGNQEDKTTSSLLLLDDVTQSEVEQHLAQMPLLFILGDTTYGSCCPDEVSANHLNASLIVHYGYACLAPTESVPVVYAFGVSGVDKEGDDEAVEVWKECVQLVSDEIGGQLEEAFEQKASIENSEKQCKKFLILYEVKYHHAMDELKLEFEKTGQFQVVVGAIPKQQLSVVRLDMKNKNEGCGSGGGACGGGGGGSCDSDAVSTAVVPASNTGCASNENGPNGSTESAKSNQSCCAKDTSSCCQVAEAGVSVTGVMLNAEPKVKDTADQEQQQQSVESQYIPRTIGGLEIPNDLDLTQYTALYIGDDLNIDSHDGNARTRLLHILLRCSAPDGPRSIWSYSPTNHNLNTDVLNSPMSPTNSTSLSTVLSRTLRRRYFLLNKAKLATTIAILIGTTSNSYSFRRLLSRTRNRIQSTGRTAYTFAVGKLSTSASKLSNFAEIDCFVLIACGESIAKFWQMEREEMLVPVLTPLELDVALGFREWDGRYSCDFGDLIRWDEADGIVADDDVYSDEDGTHSQHDNCATSEKDGEDENNSDDEDEPFFSMISGKYEQSRTKATSKQNNAMNDANLEALPGQGKLIEYRSEAAEFLKKREYRGLEANVGGTEAKAAVLGQVGIASNY